MSTRGFVGFIIDDTEKITYNHYDSYPSGIGVDVLSWLRLVSATPGSYALLKEQVRELEVVTDDTPITPDHLLNLARYTDTHVGSQGVGNEVVHDWYQLLHKTQGSPADIIESGYVLDDHKFPLSGLFCEWGYLVNFDDDTFEVYRGFYNTPPATGRWAGREDKTTVMSTDYYPVHLLAKWSIYDLPKPDEFIACLEGDIE
jgi:hypothetical protein